MSSETEDKIKVKNIETGETMTVSSRKSAETMIEDNEDMIIDEGTEKTVEPLDESPDTDNEATQSQEKTQSSEGKFTAKVHKGGVSPGEHKGTIINMKEKEVDVGKEEPATYLDLIIDVPEEDAQVKVGYNFYISENSELGKLLKRFGKKLEIGKNLDVDEVLLDQPVKFYAQKNEDGYSEVKKDTVAPPE